MGITASQQSGRASVRIKRAGGYLDEIHRPITAQEVMLKNPKHWVTKPAVFQALNPVVEVVPPEVVLIPGHTFLLVPFKTMQSLLERRRMCPASLDPLMDRPGLALREWYHQHHGTVSRVCPMKDCKCMHTKDGNSKSAVAKASSTTHTQAVTQALDGSSESLVAKASLTMHTHANTHSLDGSSAKVSLASHTPAQPSVTKLDMTGETSASYGTTLRGVVNPSSKRVSHRLINESVDSLILYVKGRDGDNEPRHTAKKKSWRIKRCSHSIGLQQQQGKGCRKQAITRSYSCSMSMSTSTPPQEITKKCSSPNEDLGGSKDVEKAQEFQRQSDFSGSWRAQKRVEGSMRKASFMKLVPVCFFKGAMTPNGEEVSDVRPSQKGLGQEVRSSRKGLVTA